LPPRIERRADPRGIPRNGAAEKDRTSDQHGHEVKGQKRLHDRLRDDRRPDSGADEDNGREQGGEGRGDDMSVVDVSHFASPEQG
jgi:hypothetical protein